VQSQGVEQVWSCNAGPLAQPLSVATLAAAKERAYPNTDDRVVYVVDYWE
jgi:hypothetical protein